MALKIPKPDLHKRSKQSFAEKFFPARPQAVINKARAFARQQLDIAQGSPTALNGAYISWLRRESMLHNANRLALKYSGKADLWQKPFAKPRPRNAVNLAPVWYTAYPISMITKDGDSILATLGDDAMWSAFQEIGIKALHTGPMKRAGGLDGWLATPSIDGHFDRISTRIDAMLGTEAEFRRMAETAGWHGGVIIDDIVPGHTGKGADFRLAEMSYRDYPGIYHMIEIAPADWHLLPDIPRGKDSANLEEATEENLKQAGYIIGKLHRVMFYEPGVKETNWSATRPVKGVDGVRRRWVYLHYFKEGQPSINWLDPSFAGMKLVVGDALHSIGELGTRGLRLDANGFLGIEKSDENRPAWSEGHPLSAAANQLIAGMVRKMGGFTFQELNLSLDDIKSMATDGADLSYDFVTRPAYQHALGTGDVEFLRLMMRSAREIGIDPASLVHALQNHDELTYELVHFWTVHKDDMYEFRGKTIKGWELRKLIRKDLREAYAGLSAPYNLLFTDNGISCTITSMITAVLGYQDIDNLVPEQIEKVKQAHLMLAMFNALQPGIFALSGWDLSGALPIEAEKIQDLLKDGDTRWINRGAYDLMGKNPGSKKSDSGMPKAISLYGTLPEQLLDEGSFARRLQKILEVRDKYQIATSHQIDIPNTGAKGLLVMIHNLGENGLQLTALNFSNSDIDEVVTSEYLPRKAKVMDMFSGKKLAPVDKQQGITIKLAPYQGTSLHITK